MGDVLAACSMILGAYTFIWSILSKDIEKVLGFKYRSRGNEIAYNLTKKVLYFNQLPLLIVSIIFAIIMFPLSKDILMESYRLISQKNAKHDIVRTILVFINFIVCFITCMQVRKTCVLRQKINELNPNKKER